MIECKLISAILLSIFPSLIATSHPPKNNGCGIDPIINIDYGSCLSQDNAFCNKQGYCVSQYQTDGQHNYNYVSLSENGSTGSTTPEFNSDTSGNSSTSEWPSMTGDDNWHSSVYPEGTIPQEYDTSIPLNEYPLKKTGGCGIDPFTGFDYGNCLTNEEPYCSRDGFCASHPNYGIEGQSQYNFNGQLSSEEPAELESSAYGTKYFK
jgi:hypothetical protein